MRVKQTARKSTSTLTWNASWETFNRRRVVLMTSNQANGRANDRGSLSPDERDIRDRTERAITATRVRYRTDRATARKSTNGPARPYTGSKMLRKNPADDVSPKNRVSPSSCRPKDDRADARDDSDDDDHSGPGPSRQSPPRVTSSSNEIKVESSA